MRKAKIFYDTIFCGVLTETNDGDFTFQYNIDYVKNHPNQFITFTMPVREDLYLENRLFPFSAVSLAVIPYLLFISLQTIF